MCRRNTNGNGVNGGVVKTITCSNRRCGRKIQVKLGNKPSTVPKFMKCPGCQQQIRLSSKLGPSDVRVINNRMAEARAPN